jgi:hypothetical protein
MCCIGRNSDSAVETCEHGVAPLRVRGCPGDAGGADDEERQSEGVCRNQTGGILKFRILVTVWGRYFLHRVVSRPFRRVLFGFLQIPPDHHKRIPAAPAGSVSQTCRAIRWWPEGTMRSPDASFCLTKRQKSRGHCRKPAGPDALAWHLACRADPSLHYGIPATHEATVSCHAVLT